MTCTRITSPINNQWPLYIQLEMRDTRACEHVQMRDTRACEHVQMRDTRACIRVQMRATRSCIRVQMLDTRACARSQMRDPREWVRISCPDGDCPLTERYGDHFSDTTREIVSRFSLRWRHQLRHIEMRSDVFTFKMSARNRF
ncbi:hypothetical protein NDU88_000669 [Pleurodeles waltl]|uniref:Uncharacterized protein n=1 Tax=Pleurodeles waltl TaxID=8319 RepID=A0AAV7V5P6_PLEWA|nr:hypothetical protein NDU88_000669 [Pleurodeles waltl]